MLDVLVVFILALAGAAWWYRKPLLEHTDSFLAALGYHRLPSEQAADESGRPDSPSGLRSQAGAADPLGDESEMSKLKARRGLALYHLRIERMALTLSERDACAYCVNKANDFKQEGIQWRGRGDVIYCLQIAASALVPVLIGVSGSFGETAESVMRVLAIALSILGTICNAINEVYSFRERGQTRVEYADQMSSLFQEFVTLTGDEFGNLHRETQPFPLEENSEELVKLRLQFGSNVDTHEERGLRYRAFRRYSMAYNRLLREARSAAFLGKAPATASAGKELLPPDHTLPAALRGDDAILMQAASSPAAPTSAAGPAAAAASSATPTPRAAAATRDRQASVAAGSESSKRYVIA